MNEPHIEVQIQDEEERVIHEWITKASELVVPREGDTVALETIKGNTSSWGVVLSVQWVCREGGYWTRVIIHVSDVEK